MPRRRQLNGIASGLLGTFVSRYNHLEGYWAIGMLCRFAEEQSRSSFRFEFVGLQPSFFDPQHHQSIIEQRYREWLQIRIRGTGIDPSWVINASAEVVFIPLPSLDLRLDSSMRDFTCTVVIFDDLGRKHSAAQSGKCWPHDPSREFQSR